MEQEKERKGEKSGELSTCPSHHKMMRKKEFETGGDGGGDGGGKAEEEEEVDELIVKKDRHNSKYSRRNKFAIYTNMYKILQNKKRRKPMDEEEEEKERNKKFRLRFEAPWRKGRSALAGLNRAFADFKMLK